MFWKRKPDPLMDHICKDEWALVDDSTMTSGKMTLTYEGYSGTWDIIYPVREPLPYRYRGKARARLGSLRRKKRQYGDDFLRSYVEGEWPYRLILKGVDVDLPNTYRSGDVWFFRDREQAMMAMMTWG